MYFSKKTVLKASQSSWHTILKYCHHVQIIICVSCVSKYIETNSSVTCIFFREVKYAILRENLANESLRNCDVRQVLCILTIFCRFKPKNVCILTRFSSFQSFQSKIIPVKCCKEVIVPPE